MTSTFNLILSVVAGMAIGIFYFGGLWLTVQKLTSATRPEILMLFSFVIRLLTALVGFYLVMDQQWERLVFCLCGFLAVRFVMTRALGPARSEVHRRSGG